MKIGVFDSGIGGLSVANAITKALPQHEVVFRNDTEHVPYGTRQPVQILKFITPIFDELIREGCSVIVVACNTVSTTLMAELRARYDVPFIAIVPMVKPAAAATKTKVIAVCATPTTLASKRYQELKQEYAQGLTVLEPDCSDWSAMIERNEVDVQKIHERIEAVLAVEADVIVLGCTHYHWIEQDIAEMTEGRAQVMQPEKAIIAQLTRVLAQLQ